MIKGVKVKGPVRQKQVQEEERGNVQQYNSACVLFSMLCYACHCMLFFIYLQDTLFLKSLIDGHKQLHMIYA